MKHTMAIALNARAFQSNRTKAFLSSALGLSIALTVGTALPSAAIDIKSVPNPRDNDGWVTDMADMLSPSQEAELNDIISTLEAAEGHEIAVVTVTETEPAATPKAFATELFNTWGIGKEEADNGILFLVSKGDRRTEIEVGYGLEETLPDAKVGTILRSQVTPQFKQGNFDTGILNGTEALVTVLNGETVLPLVTQPSRPVPQQNTASRRTYQSEQNSDSAVFLVMVLGIGGLWLASAISSSSSGRSGRSSSSGSSNYNNYDNSSSYSGSSSYNGGSSYSGSSDFGGGDSGGGGGG